MRLLGPARGVLARKVVACLRVLDAGAMLAVGALIVALTWRASDGPVEPSLEDLRRIC